MQLSPSLQLMQDDLSTRVPLVVEDRALDADLHALLVAIRAQAWRLYVD